MVVLLHAPIGTEKAVARASVPYQESLLVCCSKQEGPGSALPILWVELLNISGSSARRSYTSKDLFSYK